ncbi:MAG: Holliday junction branch migration protein RuvA [Spirochaetaceae bacterium]
MIHALTGAVTGATPTTVILRSGPMHWQLEASAGTIRTLMSHRGAEVTVFTYLHSRDDGLTLFGFATEAERALFFDLIKVDGIGPKQAIRILSGTSVESFLRSVEEGNIDALTHIRGLGKKTAQKILLSLQDRLVQASSPGAAGGKEPHGEILEALVEMGYDRRLARDALGRIAEELSRTRMPDNEREQELFRRAIVELS